METTVKFVSRLAAIVAAITLSLSACGTIDETSPDTPAGAQQTQGTTIGNLGVGQSGYTISDAVFVDMDGNYWLDPAQAISSQPSGTVEMYVEHLQDGYYVGLVPGLVYEPRNTRGADPYILVVEVFYQ